MKDRLSAARWTEMALQVLADRGIEAVRVEPLARALGVTKGSFYWHFADRQDLFDSLLLQWERLATLNVIEAVELACDEPDERLRELTRLVFRHGGPLDRAVRAWASHDEEAAHVVERVDTQRYAFVRGLLEAHGLAPTTAAMRARLLYTSLIGEQHTSLTLSRKRRVEWALANLEVLLAPG
ncbi:MAG: TetR/AcrR family transcriptional regulator [Myxococcales bacterium]|nr:TetR/AcrR family transcriptional regulator [Myxococcales bacterium]MDH3484342.1 TetR/AcrR family transcriptional regulator [Myxococcales bacterium]